MASAQDRHYDAWLEEKKKSYPQKVQGGRLDRFASAVRRNILFQAICNVFLDKAETQSQVDEEQQKVALLFHAARTGCIETIKDSIVNYVNISDQNGVTALHIAAEYGNYDDVEFLLGSKAKIEADHEGLTPLHVAAASTEPNPEVAKLLIKWMPEKKLINAAIPNDSSKNKL